MDMSQTPDGEFFSGQSEKALKQCVNEIVRKYGFDNDLFYKELQKNGIEIFFVFSSMNKEGVALPKLFPEQDKDQILNECQRSIPSIGFQFAKAENGKPQAFCMTTDVGIDWAMQSRENAAIEAFLQEIVERESGARGVSGQNGMILSTGVLATSVLLASTHKKEQEEAAALKDMETLAPFLEENSLGAQSLTAQTPGLLAGEPMNKKIAFSPFAPEFEPQFSPSSLPSSKEQTGLTPQSQTGWSFSEMAHTENSQYFLQGIDSRGALVTFYHPIKTEALWDIVSLFVTVSSGKNSMSGQGGNAAANKTVVPMNAFLNKVKTEDLPDYEDMNFLTKSDKALLRRLSQLAGMNQSVVSGVTRQAMLQAQQSLDQRASAQISSNKKYGITPELAVPSMYKKL